MSPEDRAALRMLEMGHFERRPAGWRFGTRRIGDAVVDRLIAGGWAVRRGDRLELSTTSQAAE